MMAPHILTCPACVDTQIFHDELHEDSAWHEIELRAGQRYLVETTQERGFANIELLELEHEVHISCASFGEQQVCGVAADQDAALGILVDSTGASSRVLIEVRESP